MQGTNDGIELVEGIPEGMRAAAVALYDEAFGDKFAVAIPSTERRIRLLTASLNLQFAIGAVTGERLVGLAGFQTQEGSLTDGISWQTLKQCVGMIHGIRAAMVLSLYERSLQPQELLMDGIAVAAEMRCRGVGTKLLDRLADFAKDGGFKAIRLDVIDTNSRARQLYERNGFVATETVYFNYLRWLLGFGASTTLVRRIQQDA